MSDQENRDKIQKDKTRATVALSISETVGRYGSANAEFVKGLTGIDNETGEKLSKGLLDIANHKVNPNWSEQNIKQQSGFSAEIAKTSRDNAELKIEKSDIKSYRSDDLPQYKKNHPVVDRVKILNGEIIEGSEVQMKFVGDRDSLFEKIIDEDNKFHKYMEVKLEIPSEQFEGKREYYSDELKKFRKNIEILKTKLEQVEDDKSKSNIAQQIRKLETKSDEYEKLLSDNNFNGLSAKDYCKMKAEKLRQEASKCNSEDKSIKLIKKAEEYEKLSENIIDSGITTDEAIFYRTHPKIATAIDIARTSNRAGIEGAKIGGIVGSSISILTNAFAVAQEKKQLTEATKDVALDTGKAVVLGYGAAATGAALKGAMQQSSKQSIRTLAGTNAPALAVNVVLSLGSSVKRYVSGDIDETQFLEEVGEKGAGMLSASMMAALGQVAIPIPFVGAAIGGMIGYTLSSMFYQIALDAGREAKVAKANLVRVQAIEAEARAAIENQRNLLAEFMAKEMPELLRETEQLFAAIDHVQDMDIFAASINSYAELMGAQLQFKNQMEFDDFMLNSDEPLRL